MVVAKIRSQKGSLRWLELKWVRDQKESGLRVEILERNIKEWGCSKFWVVAVRVSFKNVVGVRL